MDLVLISLASLLAGCVDAIVGGGGLVMIPALFSVFPNTHPATLFGVNKASSIWGTGFAAVQYARRVSLPWKVLAPAATAAFAGSLCGAWTVTMASPDVFRRLLPFILLAVLLYTLARKDMGRVHAPRLDARAERLAACGIGAVLGFYDGFFGPGTGSFFVFLFVRVLGYDFLHSSAAAKLLNTATNGAALLLFTAKGHVWWKFALVVACANVVGSVIGTRLALRHGAGFVRGAFIVVVSLLICKTAWDTFLAH